MRTLVLWLLASRWKFLTPTDRPKTRDSYWGRMFALKNQDQHEGEAESSKTC